MSTAIEPVDIFAEDFELSDDAFDRWWEQLVEDDRQEFLYLQGDRVLARFVCLLDYLIIRRVEPESTELIASCYAKAARIPLTTHGLRNRSVKARKHDACAALLERVRSRNMALVAGRILNRTVDVIEKMLISAAAADASVNQREKSVNVSLKFAALVQDHEAELRHERSRNAIVKARENIDASRVDGIEKEKLEAFLKVVVQHLGMERVNEILGEPPEQVAAAELSA